MTHADFVNVGKGEGKGDVDGRPILGHAPPLPAEVAGGAVDLQQFGEPGVVRIDH